MLERFIQILRWIFLFIAFTSIVLLSILGTIDKSTIQNAHWIIRWFLAICFACPTSLVVLAAIFAGGYTLLPRWFSPDICRGQLKKRVMELMFSYLFENNLRKHRLTLFKEVCYARALWHHLGNCLTDFAATPFDFRKYARSLKIARYLIIWHRVGGYLKSGTMFRVEENDEKKCEGVVGFIRFLKTGALVSDLPDISGIDLSEKKALQDLRGKDRQLVADYMNKGFVRDFMTLKRLNKKARHLYGTIVETKGKPWGVLLTDTTDDSNPFDEIRRQRFDSYAQTISAIIDTE